MILSNNDIINELKLVKTLEAKAFQLEKEILSERVKSSTLRDELEKPMNVHRWRVLESSDPKRFEKISQIQLLQKQLIVKAAHVTELDLLIQEKEKVYIELKNIIARQPGPETEEQVLIYQQTLKDKKKQLRAMDEELHMYREQIQSFKDDISHIDGKMTQLKKQWMHSKKNQQYSSTN